MNINRLNRRIMATVKVKLRPSTIEGKRGVVYYQITHHGKMQQITTQLRVHPSDWDATEGRVASSALQYRLIQRLIDGDVSMLRRIIYEFEERGVAYATDDVVRSFKIPDGEMFVLDYMRTQIGCLRASNRLGTAKNYEKTMRSFRQFLGDQQLPLSAMTEQVIADYNAFLVQRGLVRNSVSFYMRVLRAMYNKAVRQKLIEQQHPFMDVYTGVDRTRKRAVSESIVAQLNRIQLPEGSQLALCRDLFVFSFCARGMAFVDMVFLRKKDMQDGTICYARRKTGQLLTIKIEAPIQRIVDRYLNLMQDSIYLFPIITATDPHEAYYQYHAALNNYNRQLEQLAKLIPSAGRLTSYTSRHSWATAARNHNVPISVISAGMGHTTEQTTRIYLSSLENSIIDDANRLILDSLR